MLEFLCSSKRIAMEAAALILEAEKAKKNVKTGKLTKAIERLKAIASEESTLYQKIERNQEGLAREVLEQEVRATIRFAQKVIQLLEKNNIDEALGWLILLIDREINVQKWIDNKIEIRNHSIKLARNIKKILKKYVKDGMVAIELFNGEHADIIEALAELVGKNGHVYGIDELNPFEMYEHITILNSLPNVDLIKSTFPEMPVPDADVVVVREFHYVNHAGNKKVVYSALNSKLKKGGYLIIFLNHTEFHNELESPSYQNAVAQFPSRYRRIQFNALELVFQKQ